jgi:hypothetical protein
MPGLKSKISLHGQRLPFRALRVVIPYELYDLMKGFWLATKSRGPFYSQSNEEELLRRIFPERSGKYLDIGSGNPKYLSNTYHLYRKGWNGILVDPIRSNYLLNFIFCRRDSSVMAYISDKQGRIRFYQMEPSYFSTSDISVMNHWIQHGAQLVKIKEHPVIPVSSLNFESSPSEPVLISIDTEGHELEVLKSINFAKQSPRAFIIETWDSSDHDKYIECEKILKNEGYFLESTNNENDIWLHASYRKDSIVSGDIN